MALAVLVVAVTYVFDLIAKAIKLFNGVIADIFVAVAVAWIVLSGLDVKSTEAITLLRYFFITKGIAV